MTYATVLKDRVCETTTSTGTGNIALSGAVFAYKTFDSAYGHGVSTAQFPYIIEDKTNGDWEVGTSYLSDATTLVRNGSQTIIASSNSGNAVNFAAGTKRVFSSPHSAFIKALDTEHVIFPVSDGKNVDRTAEIAARIDAAASAGQPLRFFPGDYYARTVDPYNAIKIFCVPGTVRLWNDSDAPFFRTTNQKAALAAATVQTLASSVALETYADPVGATSDYCSVINVADSSGYVRGQKCKIHAANDHPYATTGSSNYIKASGITATSGSKTIVFETSSSHGLSTSDKLRLWDAKNLFASGIAGIPKSEIFSYPGNVLDHTITVVSSSKFSITVASTSATSSGTFGAAVGDVRWVEKKAFFGEDFEVLAIAPGKIYCNGILRYHANYSDNIQVNSYDSSRTHWIHGFTFKGRPMAGKITQFVVTNGGSGYTSAPTVSFSGGGGSGAAATAIISGGKVVAVVINNASEITSNGSGYTSAPTVVFNNTGTGGSGAAATAVVAGDPWESEVDNSTSFHNHTLGLWYCPFSLVENCHFENLYEGAAEFRHSPFSIMRNCTGDRLSNYKTGANGWSGRLGYFAFPYNASWFQLLNCTSSFTRHFYTDGNNETSVYSSSNWMEYGMTCNAVISNCHGRNVWGTFIGAHEGGNGLLIAGCTLINVNQGSTAGSYVGCGIQLRGQNIVVNGYTQSGGTIGIRSQATEQLNSVHKLENIFIENLYGVSDSAALGFRGYSITTGGADIINTSRIDFGDITMANIGIGFRFENGVNVQGKGQWSLSGIRSRAIQNETGSKFVATEVAADYTDGAAGSSRYLVTMNGTTTAIIHDLKLTLGATYNPSVVFNNSDSATGKTVGLGRSTVYNPSNVTEPDLVTASQDHNYTWAKLRATALNKGQITLNNSAETLKAGYCGLTLLADKTTAQVLTVPNAVPAGWHCDVVQVNTGQTAFAVESGGTLRNCDGHAKAFGRWAKVNLECVAQSGATADVVLSGRTAV